MIEGGEGDVSDAPDNRAAFERTAPAAAPAAAARPALDEADLLRARLWSLLGSLLAAAPDADLLRRLSALSGDASPLGSALSELARRAAAATAHEAEREYHRLFIGVARGELVPYASFYRTGFLNEKPLARLRADMARLGIGRAEGSSDPEDHMASLAEMMAGLIAGAFAADLPEQQQFFDRHIAPWAGRFFADLERAEGAGLYAPVGAIGRLFVEIEAQAFTLAA